MFVVVFQSLESLKIYSFLRTIMIIWQGFALQFVTLSLIFDMFDGVLMKSLTFVLTNICSPTPSNLITLKIGSLQFKSFFHSLPKATSLMLSC
jgi:hypothetical protein